MVTDYSCSFTIISFQLRGLTLSCLCICIINLLYDPMPKLFTKTYSRAACCYRQSNIQSCADGEDCPSSIQRLPITDNKLIATCYPQVHHGTNLQRSLGSNLMHSCIYQKQQPNPMEAVWLNGFSVISATHLLQHLLNTGFSICSLSSWRSFFFIYFYLKQKFSQVQNCLVRCICAV